MDISHITNTCSRTRQSWDAKGPLWALLGRWRRGFERLYSPEETLRTESREAEIGTQETLG